MFNLLPENLKKAIVHEYKLRLVIVAMSFVVLVQVSFLVFLFPSWLSSYYKGEDFTIKSDEMSTSLSNHDVNSTTSYIKTLNSTLTLINDTLEYPKIIPILESLLKERTSNIRLSGISYVVNSVTSGVLTLNGVGDSRETLVSFSKRLAQIEGFKKVDLPLSNLAKDKNIEFSININIEK